MSEQTASAIGDAVAVKIGAAASGIGWLLTWDAPVHLFGVPVAVVLAAMTGALLGVIYGSPMPTRKASMFAVITNSFIASGATAIAPHIPLFGWLKAAPLGAVALILAFAARWIVPYLVENAPAVIRAVLVKLGFHVQETKP